MSLESPVLISDSLVIGAGNFARTDRHILSNLAATEKPLTHNRMAIINRYTLELVALKTINPTTGEWESTGTLEYDEAALAVIAFDDTGTYNAKITDYVSQGAEE